MKLFKSRKLSILLALALVLTSFSFTAMADTAVAEDLPIISAAKNLKDITNAQTGLPDEYKIVTDKECVDDTTGRTVVKYSTTKYGAPSGSFNTPGKEPRSRLDTLFSSKADFTNNKEKYEYTRIKFDIYIKNAADGLGFRMQRYSTTDNTLGNECYIGVGGSDFEAGGSATAEYINTDLKVGKWNNVIIELGTNSTNKDVNFHVNGKSTACETKLPDNTYGFGGNQNRCILIPKSNKDVSFEIRLDNFSIVLTNNVLDFNIHNSDYFTTEVFSDRDKSTCTEESAWDFSTDYNKKAFSVKSTNGTDPLPTGAGSEISFQLVPNSANGTSTSLGNLNWANYKNLRIQFNAYLGYENIVLFRTVRSKDGGTTFDSTSNNHVIGVGTPEAPNSTDGKTANTSGATSGCNYRYREMTPNEWHNVVIELGANKDNQYVNIYIDGNKVTPDKTVFTNGDEAEGFGTVGKNRCVLAFSDTADSLLDVQISDITLKASDSMYNPAAAPSIDGVVRAQDSTAGLSYRVDTDSKAITYVDGRDADGMSLADFKSSNVDYFAPTDATNTKLIAYNAGSKRVAYYTLAEQEAPVLDGVQAEVGEDGRLYIEYDYANGGEEDISFKLHVAYYKNNALVYLRADTWCKMPVGLSAASYDLSMPKSVDYDKIKVFLWGSTGGENPVTIVPVLKAAEIDVVK